MWSTHPYIAHSATATHSNLDKQPDDGASVPPDELR